MSEPMQRRTWPVTDEGNELLSRVLDAVRSEILRRAQAAAEDPYADGDVPKRLIGEHALFNAFLELAWDGFENKPASPEFQARWAAIGA